MRRYFGFLSGRRQLTKLAIVLVDFSGRHSPPKALIYYELLRICGEFVQKLQSTDKSAVFVNFALQYVRRLSRTTAAYGNRPKIRPSAVLELSMCYTTNNFQPGFVIVSIFHLLFAPFSTRDTRKYYLGQFILKQYIISKEFREFIRILSSLPQSDLD